MFPVPRICEYLTDESKQRIFTGTERDEQQSKVKGFFNSVESAWSEMKWQYELRQNKWLYWFSSHMSAWNDTSFFISVFINLMVAFFYPFDNNSFDGK